MAESVFKKFGPVEYDNVKVTGHLEYQLKPWEMIFEIETKITPISSREDDNDLLYDFHKWVRKNHIGKRRIFNELEHKLLPDWKLDYEYGFGFSYNHSPEQLSFNNQSDMNITVHVETPNKPQWKDLAQEFYQTTAIFSGLSAFDSNQSVSFNSKPQEPRATFHLDKEGFAELVSFN